MKQFFAVLTALMLSLGAHAASVVSSQTTSLITEPSGRMIAEFEYTLQDNLLAQHIVTEKAYLAAGTDVDAWRIARHPMLLAQKAFQEINQAFHLLASGGLGNTCPPLFIGETVNDATPLWQTWMELAQALAWRGASEPGYWVREEFLEILPFEPCWTHPAFSRADKQAVMNDATNPEIGDLDSAIANATNVQNMINSYAPFYDDEGNRLP